MGEGTTARVLADSVGGHGVRITTVECRLPRIILAQFRTYASLSYSVRSSRAVPVRVMLGEVRTDPFVPKEWRYAAKGMLAGGVMLDQVKCTDHWLSARDAAVAVAEALSDRGAAKEHANRLLEPFAWSWAVVTGTDAEWRHLFDQRCADDAQPEMQELAGKIRDAMAGSQPVEMVTGQWHLPYVWLADREMYPEREILCAISAARCARVSYKPFDAAAADPEADRTLAAALMRDKHLSPFEHAAMCCATRAYRAKLSGWMSFRTWSGH